MVTITNINPKYIYIQATQPADVTNGKLWYDTSTNRWFTANGTSYTLFETDLTDLNRQQLEQNLNILVNSAQASSTLLDYDDMFVDLFSDSNGYDNTIDTANSTASFVTDHYEFPDVGSVYVIIEADDATVNWTSNNTKLLKLSSGKWVLYGTSGTDEEKRANIHKSLWFGTTGANQLIDDFTNITSLKTTDSRDVGKRAFYVDVTRTTSSGTGYMTGAFTDTTNNLNCSSWSHVWGSGYSFTDSNELGTDRSSDEVNNPASCDVELYNWSPSGHTYWQIPNGTNRNTASASTYATDWSRAQVIVLCSGQLTWTPSGVDTTTADRDFYTDDSIPEFTAVSSGAMETFFVQTNTITVDADPIAHQIYCHNAITGDGAITYDISLDDGTTWVTDQELNTKNTSVNNGSSMKVKLNLNGALGSDTIEVDDYAVMLFY